eukprot:12700968-Ditylum_brightwellii.AAC.1
MPALLGLERRLQQRWQNGESPKGTILRKLWEFPRALSGLSEGRDGDWIISPVQCDFCWFINLKGKHADPSCCADQQLLGYIQHANLDVLWSCSKNTVWCNLTSFRKGLRMAADLDITPPYQARGPWPLGDQGWRSKWEGMSDQMWV